jgi:hypothetical protein
VKELASDVDDDDERHAIAICDVVPKNTIWYAEFILDKHDPTAITLLRTCCDASNCFSYILVDGMILVMVPASERMPHFNELQCPTPAPAEDFV